MSRETQGPPRWSASRSWRCGGGLLFIALLLAGRWSSVAAAGAVERDVVYATVAGQELKLDVYYPESATGALPVAVYVHGGAWVSGDKSTGAGMADTPELLAHGFLVVSINYRLAPAFKWPAQIEDVKAAIRFLRAHAGRFGLDPERIGAWGGSAGGHLVAMLGVADEGAGFDDEGGNLGVSSRVRAVADLFGPADLTAADWGLGRSPTAYQVFGATSPFDPVLSQASPVTWVSADDPPFLILHGDQDATVPLSQSVTLDARLRSAGVESTLVVVRNGGHGFRPVGGEMVPSRSELSSMIADFFDRTVKPAAAPRTLRQRVPRVP